MKGNFGEMVAVVAADMDLENSVVTMAVEKNFAVVTAEIVLGNFADRTKSGPLFAQTQDLW